MSRRPLPDHADITLQIGQFTCHCPPGTHDRFKCPDAQVAALSMMSLIAQADYDARPWWRR